MAARRKAARLTPALARQIRLLVLDVDGVLTDGALYYSASGEQLKVFHVHDGHGVKQVQADGIQVAVISGRKSAAVARRWRSWPGAGRGAPQSGARAKSSSTKASSDDRIACSSRGLRSNNAAG